MSENTTDKLEHFLQESKWLADQIFDAQLELKELNEQRKAKREEIEKLQGQLQALAMHGLDANLQLPIAFEPAEPVEPEAKAAVPSKVTFTREHGAKLKEQLDRLQPAAEPEAETAADSAPEPASDVPEKARRRTRWDSTRWECSVCGRAFSLTEAIALEGADLHWDKAGNLVSLECSEECITKAASKKGASQRKRVRL